MGGLDAYFIGKVAGFFGLGVFSYAVRAGMDKS